MDKIKKNAKKIWNSKCKYLVIVACALIVMNGVNLLQTSLKFINSDGIEQEEIKLVEIVSNTWESKGMGSWKVTKSADWTDVRKATIKFGVETNGKTGHTERDIILVLDNSGSMAIKVNGKQKLAQLQSDTTDLINFLLTEEGTRIAVINFNTNATLLSGFTNDSNQLINVINGLKPTGGTNYKNAYQAVINLLSGYEEAKDRDLVMLFLTDGGAAAASAEYKILKDKYNIHICGIQYELGTSIKQSIIESSDVQYAANTINLKSIFFESIGVDAYEKFEITDYIAKEFSVENISTIRVSRGEVKLEQDSDGKQKVIWNIPTSDVKFITSFYATMEIDVIYKGEINPDKVVATNIKEEIKTKLPGEKEYDEESEKTPGIKGGYYVTYNPNLPSECNKEGNNLIIKKAYFPYEKVDRSPNNYTCSGWQIKEWTFDDEVGPNITLASDNKFIMPNYDITLTAVWAKMDLNKTMEGTVYDVPKKELLEVMKENAETSVSVDTSINFGAPSSETNGRGLYIRSGTENDMNPIYYYRGNVSNNNVLFGGMCWQIVRTTESGGIKLIYNGVSQDGRTCKNAGNSYIGASNYYENSKSPAYIGYMKGINNTKYEYSKSYDGHAFGTEITYDTSTGMYTLTAEYTSNYYKVSRYFCHFSDGKTSCSTIHYTVNRTVANNSYYFSIALTGGETIESAIEEMFSNKYDSGVKSTIDSWYKTNIDDKGYTKYIDENTVWCNDRAIISGGLMKGSVGSLSGYTMGNTYYGAIETRKLNSASANPTVKESTACTNIRDRFTSKNATTGNKALKYPVGMITADEVILAGMGYDTAVASTDSYLNTNYNYWTMTPYGLIFYPGTSYNGDIYNEVLYVYSIGSINSGKVSDSYNIRPSISLKSGTKVYTTEADGSLEYPYEVVME